MDKHLLKKEELISTLPIHAGDCRRIHDKRTRGHKSLLTQVYKDGKVQHLPITHAPETRHEKNILLQENPQEGKTEDSYILSKVQTTERKYVGKKQSDVCVKNPVDKSVIRHLKKQSKRK